jgi:hypothetical protein
MALKLKRYNNHPQWIFLLLSFFPFTFPTYPHSLFTSVQVHEWKVSILFSSYIHSSERLMPASALWEVVTSSNEVPVGVTHSIATEAGMVQHRS